MPRIRIRMSWSSTAWGIVRPICLSVLAMGLAILATMNALEGWTRQAAALGGIIVLLAVQIVFQAHTAIRGLYDHSEVIRKAAEDAERHYVDVLWEIVRFVEARDKYMNGHSERVATLTVQIAERMSLGDDQCANLRLAGRLHDVGMISVAEGILSQSHSLGGDDLRTIKKHPEIAYEILKPLQSLQEAIPAIRHHHERMNGTGYPGGLEGDDIPVAARILAVADAYDAMTHDRPQRHAMSDCAAVDELRRCAPEGYDADCVEALAELKNIQEPQEALDSA